MGLVHCTVAVVVVAPVLDGVALVVPFVGLVVLEVHLRVVELAVVPKVGTVVGIVVAVVAVGR